MKSKAPLSAKGKGNNLDDQAKIDEEENIFPDYPVYPSEEDIYSKYKEEDVDPEFITSNKKIYQKKGKLNEKDFDEDMIGKDLDIPGSEFNEEQLDIKNEDEENNYYSLGGDNHDDLEEVNEDLL